MTPPPLANVHLARAVDGALHGPRIAQRTRIQEDELLDPEVASANHEDRLRPWAGPKLEHRAQITPLGSKRLAVVEVAQMLLDAVAELVAGCHLLRLGPGELGALRRQPACLRDGHHAGYWREEADVVRVRANVSRLWMTVRRIMLRTALASKTGRAEAAAKNVLAMR